MKFTSAVLTSVLAAATLASAAPMVRRGQTKMMSKTTRFDAAGAVYCTCAYSFGINMSLTQSTVITNEPDENMVVAASINSDGTLVSNLSYLYIRTILTVYLRTSTGLLQRAATGRTVNRPAPTLSSLRVQSRRLRRARYSPPSMSVHRPSRYYATFADICVFLQAGSNTVSLFSIDSKTPTNIQQLGDVVSSEGEFPMSLAFNANGDRLCVLNGGQVNGVM